MPGQIETSPLEELQTKIHKKERELSELDLMLADYHAEHLRLIRQLRGLLAQLDKAIEGEQSMIIQPKRFIYFYLNCFRPDEVRQAVPAHVQYWQTAGLENYRGGPFADHSGGLIVFSALYLEQATEIIQRDPFIQAGLIEQKWIKEWIPE